MCDPTTIAIIAGAGVAASLGGTIMSAKAQQSAAEAVRTQNYQTQQAQQQAFNTRLQAGITQTAAQQQAAEDTLQARNVAATQMRESQLAAQQRQSDVLTAENQQETLLRQQGDTQAQALIDATNQQKLAASQQAAKDQAALLLDQNAPVQGPQPSDPQGTGDPATRQAVARRMAEAASNIRTYGAKVGALTAAGQPITDIGLAIAANKYGIMPAQQAEALLRSGSNTRLLPAQVQFRNAGDLGSAMDTLLQSKGQNALDLAGLSYGNKVAGANLLQSDITTLADNAAKQKIADAQFQQSIGGIVSGIGQLGLYGAGTMGGPSLFGRGGGGATPTGLPYAGGPP